MGRAASRRLLGEDFGEENVDVFLRDLGVGVDRLSLKVVGKRRSELGFAAGFEIFGIVEGLGEVGDAGREKFDFAAELGIVRELFANVGELLVGGVGGPFFGKFGGFRDRDFDAAEVAGDLLEGGGALFISRERQG